jgi:hypothetical protein
VRGNNVWGLMGAGLCVRAGCHVRPTSRQAVGLRSGGAGRRAGLRELRGAVGAAAVASFLAAVLTEIYLCDACSCQK